MRGLRRWWSRWWQTLGIIWTTAALLWDGVLGAVTGWWMDWVWVALMVVCLVMQVHYMRVSRRYRRAREFDRFDEPIPPRNVRVVRPDGSVIPVKLVYGGPFDSIHTWAWSTAVSGLERDGVLEADMVPTNTIILPHEHDEGHECIYCGIDVRGEEAHHRDCPMTHRRGPEE